MKLFINNKEENYGDGMTVAALLKDRKNNRASVFINGKQLLKAEYETRILCEGDEVRILRILAGG